MVSLAIITTWTIFLLLFRAAGLPLGIQSFRVWTKRIGNNPRIKLALPRFDEVEQVRRLVRFINGVDGSAMP